MAIARNIAMALPAALALTSTSSAGFVTEFNNNQAGWNAAVNGDFTTLDFTGLPPGDSPLFDQYSALGVLFPDGTDFVYSGPPNALFPLDGCGIFGGDPGGVITIAFTVPQFWIAAHHPGDIAFRLFSNGTEIYESSLMSGGSSNFSGLVSLLPFDEVELTRDYEWGIADNIYFGGAIPAAPSIALLAIAVLRPGGAGRRRSCR